MGYERILAVQNYIISSIRKEKQSRKPRSWYLYVWFDPRVGEFLYADQYFEYSTIIHLIELGVLQFNKIDLHQGIKMLQYKLINKKEES